jgi:hypothetical protein
MAKNGKATTKRATRKTAPRAGRRWAGGNVCQQTRDLVARAAEKEHVSVQKWVDDTLREAAETTLKGGYPILALPSELLHTLSDLSLRMRELSERRAFGDRAIKQVQDSASEVGDQVATAYDALAKRADIAIAELRSWTDKRLVDSGKLGAGVIEQMKGAAEGIVKLQSLVLRSEKRDERSSS